MTGREDDRREGDGCLVVLSCFPLLFSIGAPVGALIVAAVACLGGFSDAGRLKSGLLAGGCIVNALLALYAFVVLLRSLPEDPGIKRIRNPAAKALLCAFLIPWLLVAMLLGACLVNIGTAVALYAVAQLGSAAVEHRPLPWVAGGLPALAVGLSGLYAGGGMLARGVWLRVVREQIRNLATSKARAAAAGLVELKGVARPIREEDGNLPILSWRIEAGTWKNRVTPFYVEDDTGRVRVEPPADVHILHDHRIVLTQRGGGTGGGGEYALRPGDPVYVLGRLETDRDAPAGTTEESRRVVRPWSPPGARLFRAFRHLRSYWTGGLPDVFLVTDSGERFADRMLRVLWRRWVWTGIVWVVPALWFVVLGLRRW